MQRRWSPPPRLWHQAWTSWRLWTSLGMSKHCQAVLPAPKWESPALLGCMLPWAAPLARRGAVSCPYQRGCPQRACPSPALQHVCFPRGELHSHPQVHPCCTPPVVRVFAPQNVGDPTHRYCHYILAALIETYSSWLSLLPQVSFEDLICPLPPCCNPEHMSPSVPPPSVRPSLNLASPPLHAFFQVNKVNFDFKLFKHCLGWFLFFYVKYLLHLWHFWNN